MGLEVFFYPKSIALVGASNKRGKVGYSLARKLLKFQGNVYFVNMMNETIFGRTSSASLAQIKDPIDLVIIAVKAEFVLQTLKEAGEKGVKNVIIITAGFGESGRSDLVAEMKDIAKKYGIRILGPNCFGVVNTARNLDCTFARSETLNGRIGFISQSGALWSYIADYAKDNEFGFAKFASVGDMIDVSIEELLWQFEKDRTIDVIMLYIEALRDGKKFMEAISSCKKPVIVVKGGKGIAGSKAAVSHTGSLAGSYEIYKAACKQVGAYFIDDLSEALNLAKFLACYPKPKKFRSLVVTNAGGPGILMADSLETNKIEIAPLPKINFNLPNAWSHNNPIDVLGDADDLRFKEVFSKIKRMNFYDILIVILTPQEMTDDEHIAEQVINFKLSSGKMVIGCFMGIDSFRESRKMLEQNKIPCYTAPDKIGKVLGILKGK
jgi:acyl-CoA synthetase (NDP forming)